MTTTTADRIDPVGLRDIAAMYPDNVKYDTLREYSKDGKLPAPDKYINDVNPGGRTPVWDIDRIRTWAEARRWVEVPR